MGKASRGKAEKRRLKEAQTAEAVRPDDPAPVQARRKAGSFLTVADPRSDFPYHIALGILLLVALVVGSYYPALMAGFIWDDVIFSETRPVKEWSGLWDIWFAPTSLEKEGHYWPVVFTSFWLEHKLWGMEPAGYHAVNILLQLANTLVLWRLLLRLGVPGAWLIAAVFAVHPLHVESVAWVIERKDLLSGLFYMTAVLAWLRFMEDGRGGRYLLALGLFVVSLLSKTVVVTLPAALLILHWWKRGRVTFDDGLRLLPFFVIGLAITYADISYYMSREIVDFGYTLVERVLIAAQALWFYVGKILWPLDLAVIYPHWDVGVANPVAWGYLAAAVALAAALWWGRRRFGRGPLAGALFFLVTLSPVLGFIDFGYMQFSFVADRFQYLAGIGVLAVLIGAAAHWAGSWPEMARRGAWGAALVVVVGLAALSWQQARIYHDEITFFSHIISYNPDARDVYHNLGKAYHDTGRIEEALEAARMAVEKRPDFGGAHGNLGLAFKRLGRLDEAEDVLRRGQKIDPRDASVMQNLAEVVRQQGRHEEAIEWYDKVIKRNRKYALAYAGRGDALNYLRRYDEANASLKKALTLQPDMPQADMIHALAGETAGRLDRPEEALWHYRQALQIAPGEMKIHASMLSLLAKQQRHAEVEQHLQILQERGLDNAKELQIIAEVFRKNGQHEQALKWYNRILDQDPGYVQAYAGRADSLFHLKRYEGAIKSAGRAIALQPDMPTVPAIRLLMGRAAQELGREEEAVEQYEHALQANPHFESALDRLAMTRFHQERYEEALELYQTHTEVTPDNARAYTNKGVVLYKLGRNDEAQESLEHAISLDPTEEMAQTVLDLIGKSQ